MKEPALPSLPVSGIASDPPTAEELARLEAAKNEFVVVGTYETAVDAHLARGRLEVEQIEAALRDEMSVSTNQRMSLALGGIKLVVRARDVERARSVLQSVIRGRGRTRNVFRVAEPLSGVFTVVAAIPGAIAMTALLALVRIPALGAAVFAAFLFAGHRLGSKRHTWRCSEPTCLEKLRPAMTNCPRCGGVIRGTIQHRNDRLAAEEALDEQEATGSMDAKLAGADPTSSHAPGVNESPPPSP